MGSKPKVSKSKSKKLKGLDGKVKKNTSLHGTQTGRLDSKRQNESNKPKAKVPETQKELFDKIYQLVEEETIRPSWNAGTIAAKITTYLTGNKLVELES